MEVTKKDLERATRFIQNYGMNKEELLAQIEGQLTATIKVKKLFKDVQLPLVATDGSAGADLRAYLYDETTDEKVTKIVVQPNQEVKIQATDKAGNTFALIQNIERIDDNCFSYSGLNSKIVFH